MLSWHCIQWSLKAIRLLECHPGCGSETSILAHLISISDILAWDRKFKISL